MVVKSLSARGIDFELEDIGSKSRPLVMLHGLCGFRGDFSLTLPYLSLLGRTIAIDQRGHGGSTNSGKAEQYTIDGLADDILAVLDTLSIECCDLLGHSMGGMVALQAALKDTQRVSSLVLVDTTASPICLYVEEDLAEKVRLGRDQGMKYLAEQYRKLALSPDARPQDQLFLKAAERLELMDIAAYETLFPAIAQQPDLVKRLPEIHCPTTIIVGQGDYLFMDASKELHKGISGSRLTTIPGAMHSPHMENPQMWLNVVEAHLNRVRV